MSDGDEMRRRRNGIPGPVAARGGEGRDSVADEPQHAERSEEDVADLPKHGPLPAQVAGCGGVLGRRGPGEVEEQSRDAHERLGDGIAW